MAEKNSDFPRVTWLVSRPPQTPASSLVCEACICLVHMIVSAAFATCGALC